MVMWGNLAFSLGENSFNKKKKWFLSDFSVFPSIYELHDNIQEKKWEVFHTHRNSNPIILHALGFSFSCTSGWIHSCFLCSLLHHYVTPCWPEHSGWTHCSDTGTANGCSRQPQSSPLQPLLIYWKTTTSGSTESAAWPTSQCVYCFSILVPHIAMGKYCNPELGGGGGGSLSLAKTCLLVLLIERSQ